MTRASFSSHSAMVALKGSSLLVRARVAGACAGASRYFLMVCQLMLQMAFDLANGPALGPVQAMQVVDLFGGEHGSLPFMRQKATRDQKVVVGKKDPALLIQ